MTSIRRLTQCACLLVLFSCGGEASSPTPQLSRGLKIFVTQRVHGADFKFDPYQSGTTAMEKADGFCSTDPNRPTGATYKALLVDGVLRDAVTHQDWVLQPLTTYYRSYGDVEIGTTTSSAIFGAAYAPLKNGVVPAPRSYEEWYGSEVWTGIGDASDFSAHPDCCAGWSDMTTAHFTMAGYPYQTDGSAFGGGGGWGCSGFQFRIYCVEQP